MRYVFPKISHFNDIKSHIQDDAFNINDRDGMLIVTYKNLTSAAFPDVEGDDDYSRMRRECRGIAFDKATGKLLSRPFHKFFNIGEREETLPQKFDMSEIATIMNKLDGSMIRLLPVMGEDNEFEWATKSGFSDTSRKVKDFCLSNPQYKELAREMFEQDQTAIFEFCAPDNRVVVGYDEPQLTLLNIRDNLSGTYASRKFLKEITEAFGVELVDDLNDASVNVTDFVQKMRTQKNGEGVVVMLNNGHMLKQKTEWYANTHALLSDLFRPHNLATLHTEGKLDDLMPFLKDDNRSAVENFVKDFDAAVLRIHDDARSLVKSYQNMDAKEFATSDETKSISPKWKAVIFSSKRGGNYIDLIDQDIRKSMTSKTRFLDTMEAYGHKVDISVIKQATTEMEYG